MKITKNSMEVGQFSRGMRDLSNSLVDRILFLLEEECNSKLVFFSLDFLILDFKEERDLIFLWNFSVGKFICVKI